MKGMWALDSAQGLHIWFPVLKKPNKGNLAILNKYLSKLQICLPFEPAILSGETYSTDLPIRTHTSKQENARTHTFIGALFKWQVSTTELNKPWSYPSKWGIFMPGWGYMKLSKKYANIYFKRNQVHTSSFLKLICLRMPPSVLLSWGFLIKERNISHKSVGLKNSWSPNYGTTWEYSRGI